MMKDRANEKLKSAALMFAGIGAILAAAGLAYLFLTPKIYRASARIKVIDWVHASDLDHASDLSVVAKEGDLMRSPALLDEVIQNLGLGEAWAKHYGAGSSMTTPVSPEARLLSETVIRRVPNSSLIEIQVTSDLREETAKIANELARVYLNYRGGQRAELIDGKLATLKKQWEAQSVKIYAAQSNLDKETLTVSTSLATNKTQFYDPGDYETLRHQKVELEGQFVARQDELSRLEQMTADERLQVLSTMEGNAVLTAALGQLTKAKTDLLRANLDHGAEAPEVKNASLVVTNLQTRIGEMVKSTMSVKRTELQGLKDALATETLDIKNGSTNVAELQMLNGPYQEALTNVSKLKDERDDLEKKMRDVESVEAIRPAGVTAQIIDSADVPVRPFSPDGRVAMGLVGGGGFLVVVGVVLFGVGRQKVDGGKV